MTKYLIRYRGHTPRYLAGLTGENMPIFTTVKLAAYRFDCWDDAATFRAAMPGAICLACSIMRVTGGEA